MRDKLARSIQRSNPDPTTLPEIAELGSRYVAVIGEDRMLGGHGHLPLADVGVVHDRRIQGPDRTNPAKILPSSHVLLTNVKVWIRSTLQGVGKKHMPPHLDEFANRFDQRWRDPELFAAVMACAAASDPPPPIDR